MIRTYTYKLYPNQKVEKKFYQWLGTCRYVYNTAKAAKEWAYESGINLSRYDLMNQLSPLKKEDELSFVKDVHSHTLQVVIEQLDNAYIKFFKKKAKYPKWASKKTWRSFGFKQGSKGLRQTEKGFKLPKFGTVKVFNNRKIKGEIKTARLIKKADGIYLNVVAEVKDRKYCSDESQVGVDMGIKYFATLDNGLHIDNPKFLDRQLKKLRVAQRSLSRKVKGSNRRKKQVNVVQILHKKVTDSRSDFLHKISTDLAVNYSDIAIENLDIVSMLKGSHKDLNRQISDVCWCNFFELLEYKANNLVRVDPKNTSRGCSKCGFTAKENRKTQEVFICGKCNHRENADINAAKNIKARAFVNSRQREVIACA